MIRPIAILLALELFAPEAQSTRPPPLPDAEQAPNGTGAITGTVTEPGTNRPVGGAMVVLEERRPGSTGRVRSFVQLATPKGRFAFIDLPAAETYFLTATSQDFWTAATDVSTRAVPAHRSR